MGCHADRQPPLPAFAFRFPYSSTPEPRPRFRPLRFEAAIILPAAPYAGAERLRATMPPCCCHSMMLPPRCRRLLRLILMRYAAAAVDAPPRRRCHADAARCARDDAFIAAIDAPECAMRACLFYAAPCLSCADASLMRCPPRQPATPPPLFDFPRITPRQDANSCAAFRAAKHAYAA